MADMAWAADADAVAFPNTIKRRGTASTSISESGNPSMAEPASRSQNGAAAASQVDVDTCRICRGEGTQSEPLFYPCKCSGSIKYVHQDCLMEWLSHSQKKHCELCKTPFRFTKLYSPDMPKRLPIHVFATHMMKYLFRNLLIWLRAALVASVWLGCLPYAMRLVWSSLFWISDEGFGGGSSALSANRTAAAAYTNVTGGLESTVGTTTCPSGPFSTAAGGGMPMDAYADQSSFMQVLLKVTLSMASAFGPANLDHPEGGTRPLNTHVPASSSALQHQSSLLSDVSFLKNLTSYPILNRTVIYTLEGQIITVLVIVCFILIILVRDYVVQQQPEINMRAAFAAAENDNGDEIGDMNMIPQALDHDAAQNFEGVDDAATDASVASSTTMAPEEMGHGREERDEARPNQDPVERQDPGQRPIAGFRRRLTRQNTNNAPADQGEQPPSLSRQGSSTGVASPRAAGPSALDEAESSAGRSTRDGGLSNGGEETHSAVNLYLRIYRQANGDRDTILRLIREEGLEKKLEYWVKFTEARKRDDENDNSSRGATAQSRYSQPGSAQSVGRPLDHPSEGGAEESEERWAVEHDPSTAEVGAQTNNRDKGKAVDRGTPLQDAENPIWSGWEKQLRNPHRPRDRLPNKVDDSPTLLPTSSRPRAVSDGPQRQETINPLANNSWSFADLPAAEPAGEEAEPSSSASNEFQLENSWQESGFDFSSPLPAVAEDSPVASFLPARSNDLLPSTDVRPFGYPEAVQPGEPFLGASTSTADEGPEDQAHQPSEPAIAVPLEDGPNNAPTPPEAVPAQQPAGGLVNRVADFMWGDVEVDQGEDADGAGAVVDLFGGHGDPFLDEEPENERGEDDEGGANGMVPDVVDAAVAAGIDPEALDDQEDIDGILELIGLRGPIAGLFQNAIFCAFLVSVTIFLGVFTPYNIGRVTVWMVANPTRLLRMVFSFSTFIQDVVLLAVGWTLTLLFGVLNVLRQVFSVRGGSQFLKLASSDAQNITATAFDRVVGSFTADVPFISAAEIRNFSVISHEALVTLKAEIGEAVQILTEAAVFIFGGDYSAKWAAVKDFSDMATPIAVSFLRNVTSAALQPDSWTINLTLPEPSSALSAALDPELAFWSPTDRSLAIFAGYISLSVVAGLYLGRGSPFSTGQTGQEWEASLIDALNQASGVMKVILIISIEMLIFPLYCGLLLDFALLPLFEDSSLTSRVMFTLNFPLTSIFVHWFVGTGYMFHFALFVSMCRKIMRKGVLYFIRDPDDPEFHPVRDVLERNVTTQLRKILFSAFVYGALVVVCLGGVVWSLSFALPRVLPIHYSSNEPVLEFPIDLLFYNFLMPLAVKFFKPSDGLHAMYTWWFRKCARALRLTWFLFGERKVDEEGILVLQEGSKYKDLPWWRRAFLEVTDDSRSSSEKHNSMEVVPKTWHDAFDGGKAKPVSKISAVQMFNLSEQKSTLVNSGQLIPNGRFVRTPASDQVKIPKGQPVFRDVDEKDLAPSDLQQATSMDDGARGVDVGDQDRNDGNLDARDQGDQQLQNGATPKKHYQYVYIPPFFRLRIFLFILFIWIFAAVTGVSFTIVPLIFGRRMFKLLVPEDVHIRTNDIYAFSIGIYILGSASYFVWNIKSITGRITRWATTGLESLKHRGESIIRAGKVVLQGIKMAYAYTMLLLVFPLLVTLVVELYLLIPLHTYMYPSPSSSAPSSFGALQVSSGGSGNTHTIRVIQAWTLGLLYLKLGSRALTMYGGRPANAVRAVLRRGWLEPDISTLTRAFVVPGLTISLLLILGPPTAARFAVAQSMEHSPRDKVYIFRMAYPMTAMVGLGLYATWGMKSVLERCQGRIRDEAYLMGERLHNFSGAVVQSAAAAAGRGAAWRGGGRVA